MAKLFEETQIASLEQAKRKPKITVRVSLGEDGKAEKIDDDLHLIGQQSAYAADVQINKTFGDDILITAFGQKLTPLAVSGVSIPKKNMCEGGGTLTLARWYKKYNAGKRRSSGKVYVVTVAYDDIVFKGILTGLTQAPYSLSNGSDIDLFQYTLKLQGVYQ